MSSTIEYLWETKRGFLGFGGIKRCFLYIAFDGEIVGSIYKNAHGSYSASLDRENMEGNGRWGEFINLDSAMIHLHSWATARGKK